MNTRTDSPSAASLLPWLFGLTMLSLLAAGALTFLRPTATASVGATGERLALDMQRVPFEAQNALRGEQNAFDALAKTNARLKTMRAQLVSPQLGVDPNWTKLESDIDTIEAARGAVDGIG